MDTFRRPFRRNAPRASLNSQVHVSIIFKNGKVFDTGTANVKNISEAGALLSDIVLSKSVLPLKSFSIILRIKENTDLQDVVGECTLVRFSAGKEGFGPEIGVQFMNVSARDEKRIKEFVKEYGEKLKTAPLVLKH